MERRKRMQPICPGCGDGLHRPYEGTETFSCRGCGGYGIIDPTYQCIVCEKDEEACACDDAPSEQQMDADFLKHGAE